MSSVRGNKIVYKSDCNKLYIFEETKQSRFSEIIKKIKNSVLIIVFLPKNC